MATISRADARDLAVLGAVLVACLLAILVPYQMRESSLDELADLEAASARLHKVSASGRMQNQASTAEAPAGAFLDAPTLGLAGSQLQTYVTGLVREQNAQLVSVGITPPARDDPPDTIRLEASVNLSLQALQTVLYRLEGGTPYVFVESIAIRPSSAQRDVDDPLLRVTLNLRALLRRRPSS
jgi:general secretion pathway protein M